VFWQRAKFFRMMFQVTEKVSAAFTAAFAFDTFAHPDHVVKQGR
jgi:hypothetical protein